MKKETKITLIIIGLILSIITGVLLYLNQYEMRKMEKQMNKLENKIETHKENLKVLRAEWIYLTSVDRIKNVIQKNNLDFKILNSKDYVSIEEIPYDFESIKRRPDPVKIMQTYYIKEQ